MIVFEEEKNFKKGALIAVDKSKDWTSFDVVNKVRYSLKPIFGKLKVGHAGTLDPLATGLVLLCTGSWTKHIEKYMADEKEYVASVTFGSVTESYDLESEPEGDFPTKHINIALIKKILEQFTGVIKQIPPIFSAIKIDGKRAYKSARKGESLDIPAREVTIRELEILDFSKNILNLRIVCSKGTYIRSLVNDIGLACESGAYLSGLRRTRIGKYKVDDALTVDQVVDYINNLS